MRIVNIDEDAQQAAFAKLAAEAMSQNPRLYTFAEGDPSPGELFAIRWNPFTVLVLKLDDEHIPALYPTQNANMIMADLPPLKGEPQT
jgi:hypothetical protein